MALLIVLLHVMHVLSLAHTGACSHTVACSACVFYVSPGVLLGVIRFTTAAAEGSGSDTVRVISVGGNDRCVMQWKFVPEAAEDARHGKQWQ